MKKEIIEMTTPIKLIGLTARTSNADEFNPNTGKIGSVIGHYWQQGLADKILHQIQPGVTLAVYANYASDFNGPYDYFYGNKVSTLNEVPKELATLIIPAGKYVKFTTESGPMPEVVIHAWQQIWKMTAGDLGGERAYKADFEVYDERAQDNKNAVVDIYIGIK